MKKLVLAFITLLSAIGPVAATPAPVIKVYLFIQSQCPCIYNHKETFGSLVKNYRDKVSFIAVFTDAKDSDKKAQELLHDLGWKMPYIKDPGHELIRRWQPAVSTDCVLVDASGKVLYRGAIDDGPRNMGTVNHFYLKDALNACLAHQPVTVSSAKGVGCLLQ